jgi:rhodanese-related sulfurtransferase
MPDGFFANGVAVALAAGRHLEPELRTVSVDDVDTLLNTEGVVFLDARYPRDFRASHLPGAVNLPVYSGPGSRTAILDKLPTRTRIIVYCQSTGCTWAKSLASDIVLRGYQDVRLFPGGINEWEQHRQSIDRP